MSKNLDNWCFWFVYELDIGNGVMGMVAGCSPKSPFRTPFAPLNTYASKCPVCGRQICYIEFNHPKFSEYAKQCGVVIPDAVQDGERS